MRITFTGRRLALAAVLVLAGVLAPFAYSALGKSGNDAATRPLAATKPVVSPLGAASVATAQAPAAVADNPYQFVQIDQTTASGGACRSLNLPAGQDFALKSVTIVTLEPFAAFVNDAELVPVIVDGPGTDADAVQLDIPISTGAVRERSTWSSARRWSARALSATCAISDTAWAIREARCGGRSS